MNPGPGDNPSFSARPRGVVRSPVDTPRQEGEPTMLERQMAVIRAAAVPAELWQGEPPKRKGDWSLTFTGRTYWPMDPRPEDVHIEDIAHSLAMQCRYGGHSRLFYSVAEHSVWMSHLIGEGAHDNRGNQQELALIALLHDATEAYVSDVPRPLKPFLTNYEGIERRNWMAICDAFDLPRVGVPEAIADLDRRMCLREMEALMPKTSMPLGIEGPTPVFDPQCWGPEEAKEQFLKRFEYLWRERMTARYPAAYGRV